MSVGPGTRVSHYTLSRRLGAGGMGEVFLAEDTALGRQVAIKFLRAQADEPSRRRLLREARAAAALDHPNICTVYEVGSDPDAGDFVVMQYIDGESLAVRLHRGRLTPDESLRVAGHIAEALAAAHQRGVVHRDVKPQNIMITSSGRAKLLDFGLAKLIPRPAMEHTTALQLTQAHAVLGTPGYMAPEQVRGQEIDGRADLFALGCVVYECLTGQRAFAAPTSAETVGLVLHVQPPPPSVADPVLGDTFDRLCGKLLEKDASQRVASADEALGMIRALSTVPLSTGTGTARSRSSALVLPRGRRLAGIAALGLAAIAATIWLVRESKSAVALPEVPLNAQRRFDESAEAIREGSFSGARSLLEQAVGIAPRYAQAYARLAEVQTELDDDAGASLSLLHVRDILPDWKSLNQDLRLRLEAVNGTVQRNRDSAIDAYRRLVALHQGDASEWIDLGRAQEAAWRMTEARSSYAKAVALDGQYAAAHLRLGGASTGDTKVALHEIDEAVRLYRLAGNVEGESQSLLKKSSVLEDAGDREGARKTLESVLQLSGGRYVPQHVQAGFELARLTAKSHEPERALKMAESALDEASRAGLDGLAANGLVDLAIALGSAGRFADSDAMLDRSMAMARKKSARRTEMRARLQQANNRVNATPSRPEEAAAIAGDAATFFAEAADHRLLADARQTMVRAAELREQYDEAGRLATGLLTLSETVGNEELKASALESLSSEMESLGRLPEALSYREQEEETRQRAHDVAALPVTQTQHAKLLILLGRADDAEPIVVSLEQGVQQGLPAYASRPPRIAMLRALAAAIAGRFSAVLPFARRAAPVADASMNDAGRYGRILAALAQAQIGAGTQNPAEIEQWAREGSNPSVAREIAYWAAETLVAQHEPARARAVALDAWSAAPAAGNKELRWRLGAIISKIDTPGDPSGATIRAQAQQDLAALTTQWGPAAKDYTKRADLAALAVRLK